MFACLNHLQSGPLHAVLCWLQHRVSLALGHTVSVGHRDLVVLRPLGEGGYSVVLLCADGAGDLFALKKSLASEPEQAAVALKEIDLLKALQHPNVVRFWGSEVVDQARGPQEVYVLMEYCEQSVLKMMQAKSQSGARFTEGEVAAIAHDLVAALAHLHSRDPPVAHRDVKADNLLRAADGRYKLCDFGSCARHAYEPASTREINALQEEVDASTTLQYRAPEMCDLFQKLRVDERVDVWAVGCVVFYLCYWDLPFGESKLQILNGKWAFPETEWPEAWQGLIRGCLAQDPADRSDIWAVMEGLCRLRGQDNHCPRPDPCPSQPVYRVPE